MNFKLYSCLAFNLSRIQAKLFQNLPPYLFENFIPNLKQEELKLYLPEEQIKKLKSFTLQKIETELEICNKKNIRTISIFDNEYPQLLKQISDPPPLIYAKGNILNNKLKLSIIGPRRPTNYGIEATHYFISTLSPLDIETVSGMALGIDALVHKLSCKQNLNTIAVLGSGVDVIYPKTNINLYNEISKKGTIISEFPRATVAQKFHFPMRNRIIAALSMATLVIEATLKSGSMITAKFAADFGRDVFAVPGSIFNYNSSGTHELILHGAKPIRTILEILEENPFNSLIEQYEKNMLKKDSLPDNETEASKELIEQILNFLMKPRSINNIIDFCDKKNYRFSYSLLTMLELNGLVKITPNNLVLKTGRHRGKKLSYRRIPSKSETY